LLAVVVLPLIAASCPRRSETPSAPSTRAAPDARVAVLLSADVRGYLEPCGCSEFMLGGLDRAAAQVEQARAEDGAVAHINGGDSLFAGVAADESHTQQELFKAKAVVRAFATMDTFAEALGPRDRAMGAAALSQLGNPYPLLGEPGSPSFVVAERGGVRLGAAAGADLASLKAQVVAARAAGAEFVWRWRSCR
jgi:2',3'-cyclic-nucleotide 2'-phosphodiesterase (5'-nucleotidase family)